MTLPRVEFVLIVETTNPLNGAMGNSRVAAMIRSATRAKHRKAAMRSTREAMLRRDLCPVDLVPCVVALTRLSAGYMDDDGLAGSQKGVRDGIAAALCVDDGSAWIRFVYGQEKCKSKFHAVRVTITKRETRQASIDEREKLKC